VTFALHPQLAADTIPVGELPLCHVLLMNNWHFPWLILVPKRDGMRELFDLSAADYSTAMQEVRNVAQQFQNITGADKINIAALGNMVPQLHIHIIARFAQDDAWPKPVWNSSLAAEPYAPALYVELINKIRSHIAFL